MKEKKDRVEDALNATRAAVEEGIIPGGGTAFVRTIKVLDDIKPADDDELAGLNIVRRSLEEPLRLIAGNAGHEGSVVVEKVREGKDGFGFNAATGEYEDLIKAGVIDPKKVARYRSAERRFRGFPAPDHRMRHCRKARTQEGHARHARYGRHGRHGRHVLSHGLAQPSQPS